MYDKVFTFFCQPAFGRKSRDGMVQGTYRVDKEAVEEAFDEIFLK